MIVAGAGNDRIRGLGGNDVICGGEGADAIQGGPGNDRLFGELDLLRIDDFGRVVKKGDTVSGGEGDDSIDLGRDVRPATEGTRTFADGISYVDAPAAVVVDFQSASTVPIAADGNDTVTGFDHGIRVFGSPLGDTIKGTNSDDTLSGTVGIDTFVGGSGEDVLASTSESHQMFRGGGGVDTVSFPIPVESGFVAKGYGGQDKLRLLPTSNPSLKPTLRIDQQNGKITIRDLLPVTLEGSINGFSDIVLPARTLTIFKGSNESEVITAHPDYRVLLYGRGGADTCRATEKRSSC